MDNLLKLQTQSVVHLALLEQGKIIDSIKTFEKYQNYLKTFKDADEQTQEIILKEINKIRQEYFSKLIHFGNLYVEKGDYSKASLCYTEVLQYIQKDIYILINYIICLYKLEQYDLEEEFLEYLETIIPQDNALLYKDLSKFYTQINKTTTALSYLFKYAEIVGEENLSAEDYNMLGMLYNNLYVNHGRNLEDAFESLEFYLKADEINPLSQKTTRNIALASVLVNNTNIAKMYWDKLFKLGGITKEDLLEYSMFCLKIGDFENFYKYYDNRFEVDTYKNIYIKSDKPLWKGENLSNKTLLIQSEQGFGDTFLMSGYLPRILKTAKKIIFLAQGEVCSLLKESFKDIEVLPINQTDITKLEYDYHIPTMSIPSVLKLTKENISVVGGYLKTNCDLTEKYKEKYFDNDKLKIGFAFMGNIKGKQLRDIPLKEFLPFDNLENVELYSLTIDIDEKEYKIFKNNKIHVFNNVIKDFSDTASLVENCDIIITSDNCILNLAGALGKKTIGLFNWNYEARWFDLTGKDCGWFTSVKPIVNEEMNNWKPSIEKAIEEVKALNK